ncbi:hypothetical protein [Roseivivax sp.]
MKSWRILSHSIRLVWRNRVDALKISALLYGLVALAQLTLAPEPAMMQMPEGGMMPMPEGEMPGPPANFGLYGLMVVLNLVVSIWIAVAWHRYVLLEEYPAGWLTAVPVDRAALYFALTLMIGLAVSFSIGLPVLLLSAIAPPLLILAIPLGIGASIALFFRLGPILPAMAVGQPLGIREALEATRGTAGTALAMAGLGVLLMFALLIPLALINAVLPALGLVAQIAANWFVTLVSVSVLTTLHGHYIEGRPID